MLKIKDNVDLKELEKFGIVYHNDIESSYYGCCEKNDGFIEFFINNARVISIYAITKKSIFDLDILYDLIQANLVEKV